MMTRPLHFILIADCSGSMKAGGKIQSLNIAIHEAIPAMREVADNCPNAEVLVRSVAFSDGARWHIADPTPVETCRWDDLEADGYTDLGAALHLVADAMHPASMGDRGLPPVLVLVSDGQPTDDFAAGMQALLATVWGRRSVRLSIAIGADADLDTLRAFSGGDRDVLRANNPEMLARGIRWAATSMAFSVAMPPTVWPEDGWGPVATWPVPHDLDAGDVW
jgi:uncharacterized protein YegL